MLVWVIDSSSLIELNRTPRHNRTHITDRLSELVNERRLVFPKQVISELERRAPDLPSDWAKNHEDLAVSPVDFGFVKTVLEQVPDVLDPHKSGGPEEADSYILAMALEFKQSDTSTDVRIVTEELKTTPAKMSLRDAAGFLGLPSVSFRVFLTRESILAERFS